jgi:hypothetical protein
MWSYDKRKRFDKKGMGWHFVHHYVWEKDVAFEDLPFELYFRNEERTEFGLLRYEKRKDYPYRDWEKMLNKIMNNIEFRKTLLNAETKAIWNRNWK